MDALERRYYTLLGVPPTATPAQIKAAYRRLAKTAHPDVGGDPDHFVEITKAYNVLSNPTDRERYDLSGEVNEVNATEFQLSVINMLANAFQQVIEQMVDTGIDFKPANFMPIFENCVATERDAERHKLNKIETTLKLLHQMRGKIRRKGEGKNVFADIIAKRIIEMSELHKLQLRLVDIVDRCLEEVRHHEDIVTLIRQVQSGAYPARGGVSGAAYGNWIVMS